MLAKMEEIKSHVVRYQNISISILILGIGASIQLGTPRVCTFVICSQHTSRF